MTKSRLFHLLGALAFFCFFGLALVAWRAWWPLRLSGEDASARVTTDIPLHEPGLNKAWHAFDGDDDTLFHSAGGRTTGSLTLDFRRPVALRSLRFIPQKDQPTRLPVSFLLEASEDGTAWASFARFSSVGSMRCGVPHPQAHRRWRLVFDKPNGAEFLTFAELRLRANPVAPSLLELLLLAVGSFLSAAFIGWVFPSRLRGWTSWSKEVDDAAFHPQWALAALGVAVLIFALPARVFLLHWSTDAPRIQAALAEAAKISCMRLGAFLPEPSEQRMVLSGIVLLPLLVLGIGAVGWRLRARGGVRLLGALLCLGGVALAAWALVRSLRTENYWDLYFGQTAWYSLLFGALGAAVLRWRGADLPYAAWFRRVGLAAGILVAALACALLLKVCLFAVPPSTVQFSFNAVYYSVTQVCMGEPLLVDGFNNTYGLYPLLLVPLFKLVPLSAVSFTTLMAVLSILTFALIAWAMRALVGSRVLAFGAVAAMVFYGYFLGKAVSHDLYFQYFPLRTIFPALILALIAAQVPGRRPVLSMVTGALVPGLAFFWTPDTGIVVAGTWLVAGLYLSVAGEEGWRRRALEALRHVVVMLLGFFSIFGSIAITYRLAYGRPLDLEPFFASARMFGKLGYFCLPMPLWHPWILYTMACGFLFALSVLRYFQGHEPRRNALRLSLMVLTTGLFVYFMGRSHPWTFLSIFGWLFPVLAAIMDELQEAASVHPRKAVRAGMGAVFVLIGAFLFSAPVDLARLALSDFSSKEGRLIPAGEPPARLLSEAAFIREHSRPGDRVLILSLDNQGWLHQASGTRSAMHPGYLDLFFKADLDRMVSKLESASFPVFLDRSTPLHPALRETIDARFAPAAEAGRLVLLTNRLPGGR